MAIEHADFEGVERLALVLGMCSRTCINGYHIVNLCATAATFCASGESIHVLFTK